VLILKELGQSRPRSKYNEQRKKQMDYSSRRRKPYELERRRRWQLLHLCAKRLDKLAAEAICATNDNRSYCSDEGIRTNFKPKGRRTLDAQLLMEEDQQRAELGKARFAELEGSYGNDKKHYGLRKIKARNEHTEIALMILHISGLKTWIFFGMMTANAMKVARRKHKRLSRIRKARAA
jgi:hypothetical protein